MYQKLGFQYNDVLSDIERLRTVHNTELIDHILGKIKLIHEESLSRTGLYEALEAARAKTHYLHSTLHRITPANFAEFGIRSHQTYSDAKTMGWQWSGDLWSRTIKIVVLGGFYAGNLAGKMRSLEVNVLDQNQSWPEYIEGEWLAMEPLVIKNSFTIRAEIELPFEEPTGYPLLWGYQTRSDP
jgi:hypothetical protein